MDKNSSAAPAQESPSIPAFPLFFREWPSWAAWAAPTKRPLDLRRALAPASTTNQDTWSPYTSAERHLLRTAPPIPYPPNAPLPLGVGILIARPLVFIDFDDLTSEEHPTAPEWATALLQRAADIGAYTEHSGGGHGAHILLRVTPQLPALLRNRYTRQDPHHVGIEVYDSLRFCALTGRIIHPHGPVLNNPEAGDQFVASFLQDLSHHAAPILAPAPTPTPLQVPPPTPQVLALVPRILTHTLQEAFQDPAGAFQRWQQARALRSLDTSRSAWRFGLFIEACRQSPISPLPVYEFFNPTTTPAHPGIQDWAEFSGHIAKPHRKYADILRAHAIVTEELRLLALDLGAPLPPTPTPHAPTPTPPPPGEVDPSWAQLGLVMTHTPKGLRPVPSSINIERVLLRHPHFQTNRIERSALDGTTLFNRKPMSDTQVTRFLEPIRAVLDLKLDPPAEVVRAAVEVIADDHPYDPIQEYLTSLPRFTPPPNYDPATSLLSTWLQRIGATMSPHLQKFSRRIMIGMVARGMKPGIKFDYVPVLEGPQGIGKSTLVAALSTPDFYATLFTGLHSKDSLIALRGKWAVEISELAAFKRTDNETMKSFFSTAIDDFRPPYGRANIKVPRRSILFGTTNDRQYLTDHTGARRFWPIDFAGPIDIHMFLQFRDQLFSEAVYAFNQGEAFHDTYAELSDPNRQRDMLARMVTPAWQIKLIQHLQNLPRPHLGDSPVPGVFSADYIASLQATLDLPGSVAHMGTAQLAAFFRRAGFIKLLVSYRTPGGAATKLSGWAHPALAALPTDMMHAFLHCFPKLFRDEISPPVWQDEELALAADEAIKTGPGIVPLDFSFQDS